MNTSFTQGPWHIAPSGRGESHRITNGETSISHVLPVGDDQYANARLIAASPRMYEALVKMEKTFNVAKIDPMSAFVAIESARAAINLATGQES
jgi:hypothetical protein